MKIFLISILIIPTLGFAKKKINANDMSMLGKIDESNLNKQPNVKKPEAIVTANNKYKVTLLCKDKTGVVYNESQVGYDNCLNDLKNRSDFSKKNSGVNVNDSKKEVSSGMSFKIGD